MNDVKVNEAVHESALVLANAAELASTIITKIAGNDISTAVNGSTLTRDMIQSLVVRGVERAVARRVS